MEYRLWLVIVLLRLCTIIVVFFVNFRLSPHIAGKIIVLRRRR